MRLIFALSKLHFALLLLLSASATAGEPPAENICMVPVEGPPSADLEYICTVVIGRPSISAIEKAEAYYVRGYAKVYRREDASAIRDFEQGLELAPNLGKLHRQLGYVYYLQNDIARSRNYVRRALELDFDDSKTHSLLAKLYYRTEGIEAALDEFEIAIQLDPANVWARYQRSSIYYDLKDYGAAYIDSEWLMNMKPSAIVGLGTVHLYSERADLFDAVQIQHASILMDLGRRAEAEQVLNKLVKTNRTAVALFSRALLVSRMPWGMGHPRRIGEATPDFEAALKLSPKNSFMWHSYAFNLQFTHRNEQALEAIDTAIATLRQRGELGEQTWARARILRSLGRMDEAIEQGIATMTFVMKLPPRFHAHFFEKFRRRGYWQSTKIPKAMTEEIKDATTACFLDRDCG